jgi:hypothetical protein
MARVLAVACGLTTVSLAGDGGPDELGADHGRVRVGEVLLEVRVRA